MSEAKHTLGPWEAYETYNRLITIFDPRTRLLICNLYQVDDRDSDINVRFVNSPANAHLIAAAPDLLEALKDMVSDRNDLSQATIDYALETIAKAEGKADA